MTTWKLVLMFYIKEVFLTVNGLKDKHNIVE